MTLLLMRNIAQISIPVTEAKKVGRNLNKLLTLLSSFRGCFSCGY